MSHRKARQLATIAGRGLLLALLFLAGGCSLLLPKPDPRPVEAIVNHAEELVGRKAYAGAADEYAIVLRKQTDNGAYYLRSAELLERIDEDQRARKTYERALKNLPPDDKHRHEIMLRLALIDANHLFLLDDAEELLQQLPDSSVERHDLAGFLYYKSGQYDLAISILNKALERCKDNDMRALMLYHAALIYRQLGDEKNTYGSLYHAINQAQHLGLIRDIERLWNTLNEENPSPSSRPVGG